MPRYLITRDSRSRFPHPKHITDEIRALEKRIRELRKMRVLARRIHGRHAAYEREVRYCPDCGERVPVEAGLG